jgi:isoquinoline 1-oxidoreductase beta subunit
MADGLSDLGRRDFLKLLAGGGLLVCAGATGADAASTSGDWSTINGWIRVSRSGDIEFLSNTSEIGQGTGTALAQIVAEELDVEWQSVRLGIAPVTRAFFNPQWGEYATYGSGGIRFQFAALRTAGAQARAMLISAAAEIWKIPPAQCTTERGYVRHRATQRRFTYGHLAADAATQPVPAKPALKPSTRWRVIGTDARRFDIPSKVNGSAGYGLDVRLPGLLVAAIRQSPRFGGKLARVDPAPAMAIRGVRQVVSLPDAVAAVAGDYWTAASALARLEPVWDVNSASTATSSDYAKAQLAAVRAGGKVFAPSGTKAEELVTRYDAAQERVASQFEAEYGVPFLCHAPMEPMNATALVTPTRAELWLPTQGQSAAIGAVAKALGLSPDAVEIHTTFSGGGFGRRIEFDFAVQAALIARAVNAPVKLVWSREEDMRHDFYRPAVTLRLRAGLDGSGWPVRLRVDSACESLLWYSVGGDRAAAMPVDPSAVGSRPTYYELGPMLFAVTTLDVGVPVGYWRSVAASQNMFAYESFLDELAHAARVDPIEWRRRLLANSPRELRVLDAVADRASWSSPAEPGRSRGVALIRANGTIVALIVELAIADDKTIRIHRITAGMDCGIVVNPDSVRAQIEGAIAYGLSAAMYGEITVANGAIEQSNFNDYPPIRIREMPPIEMIVLNSSEAPGGVGEESVSPVAPALANAIFAATGQRIRTLPFSRAGFRLA